MRMKKLHEIIPEAEITPEEKHKFLKLTDEEAVLLRRMRRKERKAWLERRAQLLNLTPEENAALRERLERAEGLVARAENAVALNESSGDFKACSGCLASHIMRKNDQDRREKAEQESATLRERLERAEELLQEWSDTPFFEDREDWEAWVGIFGLDVRAFLQAKEARNA